MWVIADMGQLFFYAPELFWAFDSDLFILAADSKAALEVVRRGVKGHI